MKPLITTCVGLMAALMLSAALVAQQPNPQMKAVLDKLASLNPKPIPECTPEEARKQPSPADAIKALMKDQGKKPEPVEHMDNTKLDLGGRSLSVRIYTPKGDGPFPVILYIHGGGWVLADLDTYDASGRALCNAAGAVVVSTHYRQAPENPFPASHVDVLEAYKAVLKNDWKYNYDSKRVAVVGESAGGNMAAALCMMAREAGLPMPLRQVLIYPVADTSMSTPSYEHQAMAKPLNAAAMKWFFSCELARTEDAKNPRLNLVGAGEELKGLPPATIINAELDPLRSEGETLAKLLEQAGVKVTQKTFPGVTHEFFGMGAVLDEAKEAVALAASELKSALASGQGAK